MSQALKLTRYVVTSDPLTVAGSGRTHRVVFSTRSGALLVVDAHAWQAVADGAFAGLPAALRQQLADAAILVPQHEDEIVTVVRENQDAIEGHRTLYQVVQPTAWCQLGCHYCGQAHTKSRLGEAGQQAFLARVRERLATGRYDHLKIGWFGAEPLAGLGVMRRLGEAARALATEMGCTYSARIVTNGMALTPAVADELVRDHAIAEAEVTLDGLGAEHDARRFTKAGKGSFARIFANLRAVAAATPLAITLRCNVDRSNAEAVAPLIRALADAGLNERVTFYTSPVYAWGNDAHEAALERRDYAERELEWLALQLRLGFRPGLIPPRRKIVCMSVQRDAEVVDAYGNSFNCTEAPYVPSYGEPNRYATRLADGAEPPAEPAAELRRFNEQLLEGVHASCIACPMLPVCGGQCPKAWQEGHVPCPSAKSNMRERLNIAFAAAQAAATAGAGAATTDMAGGLA